MTDNNFGLSPARRDRAGRTATMSQAMAAIPDGARVGLSPICAVPTSLIAGMCKERDRWQRIELVVDYVIEPLEAFDHPGEPFHLTSLQPSRAVNKMRDAGALRSVPASYGQFAAMQSPEGPLELDVLLIQISPPGPDGRFSMGVSVGAQIELLRTAPLVIAEVNPHMPYTFGAGEIQRDEIDLLVDVDHPLVEMNVPDPDDAALAIGRHAAREIPDGSVLELGIGAIPEAILSSLHGHKNIGIHSGMLNDAVCDLADAGVVTGATKKRFPGKIAVAAVVGSARSFDWVHRNEQVITVPATLSHGVPTLSQIEGFVAINSALEVASDGSVNAEMAAGRVLSGPGGQPDFAVGASLAPRGRSIIALPSTAARGTVSRIVDRFAPGTTVTVPRYLVDLIVTEYGVAKLRGVPVEERAAALAAITHPDYR